MAGPESLSVIALISGGKDSFFSILHCLENGHKVVALANLYPPVLPKAAVGQDDDAEEDLNSYMYQTVGHTVIPLYEQATGIPLYRQEIKGTAVQGAKTYRYPQARPEGVERKSTVDAGSTDNDLSKDLSSKLPSVTLAAPEEDETESLVPLLRKVMVAHPEANAVSTGAILSTYQRTRIESVALRLGLVPLAYLWQYPNLPPGTQLSLLQDMEAVGLDARIIKVASGGLDESFLWENVASDKVMRRVERAMKRFGGGDNGSVLGEGGEFETLVLDGPRELFKGKIVAEDEDREVVREGGGSACLTIKRARVVKPEDETSKQTISEKARPGQEEAVHELPGTSSSLATIRKPGGSYGLEEPFEGIISAISLDPSLPNRNDIPYDGGGNSERIAPNADPKEKLIYKLGSDPQIRQDGSNVITWTAMRDEEKPTTVEVEMQNIIAQISNWLRTSGKGPGRTYTENDTVFATILLRSMDSFASVNKIYGELFQEPNPPARVTVACGDMLPEDCQVSITLTFDPKAPDHKRALHVQSRSYWAPANIGPYSQAISIPVTSDQYVTHGPRLVYVAGQIPLVPASMRLGICDQGGLESYKRQAGLALQHLWRIGKEMNVAWWTSAVAYIPNADTGHDPALYAQLAGKVWEMRHVFSENEQEHDERDLWDERYRGALGSGADVVARPLPDYNIIECTEIYIPPFFAAVVDALPRDSWIEWHAHLGVTAGPIKIRSHSEPNVGSIHRCLIERGISVTTVILTHRNLASSLSNISTVLEGKCPLDGPRPAATKRTSVTSYLDRMGLEELQGQGQIIPCKSIWDKDGQRLAAVFVYRDECLV